MTDKGSGVVALSSTLHPHDSPIITLGTGASLTPWQEHALVERITPAMSKLDIPVLGAHDVPKRKERFFVGNSVWEIVPMKARQTYDVPPSVYDRILLAEQAGVPLKYWLWLDEVENNSAVAAAARHTKAALEAGVGLLNWIGDRLQDYVVNEPAVVGVIPTGDHRGIWCLLGSWYK